MAREEKPQPQAQAWGFGHPGAPSSSSFTTGILAQVCLAAGLGVEPAAFMTERHHLPVQPQEAGACPTALPGDCPALVNLLLPQVLGNEKVSA